MKNQEKNAIGNKITLKPLKSENIEDLNWRGSRFAESDIKVLSYRDGVALNMTRVKPGGYTFPHQHLFRQIRYILEGEFIINGITFYGANYTQKYPKNGCNHDGGKSQHGCFW